MIEKKKSPKLNSPETRVGAREDSESLQSSPEAVPLPQNAEQRRQLYNKLVRTAKINKLLLRSASFDVKPEIHSLSDKAVLKREIQGSVEVVSHGNENGRCIIMVSWTALAKIGRKNLVKGTASYIINYRIEPGANKDIVEEFAVTMAKAATYPYFRTLYSQFDWSAEIGSPPLPVLQFKPKV